MLRWLALAAWLACAAPGARAQAIPADPFEGSARAYLVRVDGRTLWAHAEQQRLPPASLTKVMTALLVVDTLRDEQPVVVSARAAAATGARIGLVAGDQVSVGDLLAALLVRSANDACVALAEKVSGSEARFVRRMNERATALGLRETHFANACGFDAPGHYASARDLAKLADLALDNQRIARRAALPRTDFSSRSGKRFRFDNTNALIGRIPGSVGLKTGHTRRAGHCLVGVVERDGRTVMVVLLGARDRWWDAVAMIDQAFERAPPPGSR